MIAQAKKQTNTDLTLSLVTDIRVRKWASELVLVCLDDPVTRQAYEVVFTNCREVRWSVDDSTQASDAIEADIIGFHLGKSRNREPAVLTTDLFELSVVYDRLEVRELEGQRNQRSRKVAAA